MTQEQIDFIDWLREKDYCRLQIGKFIGMEGNLSDNFKYLYTEFKKETIKDTIVESVINQFKERSSIGINKYGVTLDRTDLSTGEWIEHAIEESMDFILYLRKIKTQWEQDKMI